MRILGIESSCDDTACAVVEDGARILSSVVSSQDDLNQRFGGVVPEMACRAHIESILPVMQQALDDAGMRFGDVEAVAVTTTPGLIGALLIGLTAAKATCLYLTHGPLSHELLGATVDDAAGEAFDKAASILKLSFPNGPAMAQAALGGDPNSVRLPRAWLDRDSLSFSFSGLKTAMLYHCLGQNASKRDIRDAVYTPRFVADAAAGFQEAVVDVLVRKTRAALQKTGAAGLILGGGVGCNIVLRERLRRECEELGVKASLTSPELCRDNAAIIAGLAHHMYEAGRVAPLSVEAAP